MKISEIVEQLRLILPMLSDKYSENIAIDTIFGDGATATVTTLAPHGLSVGDPVYLISTQKLNTISSVTVFGNSAEIETLAAHDLTLGWPPHESVTLSGFTDSAWNGDFKLIGVPNRLNFKIEIPSLSQPTLTGSENLEEIVFGGFNGTSSVLNVINDTVFTFSSSFSGDAINGNLVARIRIFGSATAGRPFEEYTKQAPDDLVLFVSQIDSVPVSKDRKATGDAISEQGRGTDFQLDILDGFDVYAIINSKNDKAGLDSSDILRDEVLIDLLKSIQRYEPNSGLSNETPLRVVFTGHGPVAYTGALYAHRFTFQIPLRMTIDDTVDVIPNVAFRNIDLSIINSISDAMITANIDLDDEPLGNTP